MHVSHQNFLGLDDSLGTDESFGTAWILAIYHTEDGLIHPLVVISLLGGGLKLSVHHALV